MAIPIRIDRIFPNMAPAKQFAPFMVAVANATMCDRRASETRSIPGCTRAGRSKSAGV
jgi:hypothetical protein